MSGNYPSSSAQDVRRLEERDKERRRREREAAEYKRQRREDVSTRET